MKNGQAKIINRTAKYVKDIFKGESSGHDWWHTYRVYRNALHIAKKEGGDRFIISLAALLHDIDDYKLKPAAKSGGGLIQAKRWLKQSLSDPAEVSHILRIIEELSFKGAKVKTEISSLEGKIVQDADRLDAIGAIGIARAFAYGGHKNRELHNPKDKPRLHESFEKYKSNRSTSINHFYEKLLLLRKRMNTKTAKKIAKNRHDFMLFYLRKFYSEWECLEARP